MTRRKSRDIIGIYKLIYIGSDKMKSSEAQKKASTKYNSSRDNIMIRPTKEDGAKIRKAAEEARQPVQQYVLQAIWERMEREHTGGVVSIFEDVENPAD